MRYTQAYIPPNLGTGTLWGGLITFRNAAEAATALGLAFVLNKFLSLFLPYMISISICGFLGLSTGFIALAGVKGEPLSVFLLNIFNYSNTRTYVTLRPPRRELYEPARKKSRMDAVLERIFVNGPKEETSGKKGKGNAKKKR